MTAGQEQSLLILNIDDHQQQITSARGHYAASNDSIYPTSIEESKGTMLGESIINQNNTGRLSKM